MVLVTVRRLVEWDHSRAAHYRLIESGSFDPRGARLGRSRRRALEGGRRRTRAVVRRRGLDRRRRRRDYIRRVH